ncbi:hypothetical protein ANPL_02905 [Anaplasma platys]|uniref:Uncharacterized protein n=2 Tax=Anaplasma platys TaxID=949 RepID=A0A858PYI9_9RICK|nr:hypothetical protein ANPL_02905 [Anaplasma platys]
MGFSFERMRCPMTYKKTSTAGIATSFNPLVGEQSLTLKGDTRKIRELTPRERLISAVQAKKKQ